VEQLQKDWRAAATKAEQLQREAAQQKKAWQADPARTSAVRPETARRSILSERVKPETPEKEPAPLSALESQAERELKQWQSRRESPPEEAAGPDDPPAPQTGSPDAAIPPKTLFKHRPWFELK